MEQAASNFGHLIGSIIGILILSGLFILIRKLLGLGPKPRSAQANQQVGEWARTLGVSPDAGPEDIQIAYLKKMQLYGPERLMSLGPESRKSEELEAKKIVLAFEELKKYKAMSA